MPHPQHRQHFPRPRLSRLRGLWRRPPRVVDAPPWPTGGPAIPDGPATLVDAEPGTEIVRRGNRVAQMIAAHDSGRSVRLPQRPRANPAFAEAVFVELMRAHQYRRAFDQLSGDCRRAWGSPEAFAAAQAEGSMSRLRGMRVKGMRHLAEWTDQERNVTHREVAELDVDYVLGTGETAVVSRVVHLVADSGTWRSLCYPTGTVR